MLGRNPDELAPDDPVRQAANARIAAFTKRREAFMDAIVPQPLPDGRVLWQAVSGKPIFDAEGRFRGYRGSTRDVTAQHLAELETVALRSERDIAAGADRAKTQFLASMSHELRTPLNAVIGFSEFMMQELFGPIGNPRYAGYARDIHASAQHLLAVINDILDMSRLELGRYRLEPEAIGLPLLVGESVRMVAGLASAAGIACTTGAVPEIVVRVDARSIKQILVNLLGNAVKFTPAGGRIEVGAALSAEGLRIAVTDTGVGMSPRVLAGAFEAFARGDARAARSGAGAGLGLWISRALARLHGGDLSLASTEGAGTTATLTLPLGVVEAPGARPAAAPA
jgi:signal transduction histidine kinase